MVKPLLVPFLLRRPAFQGKQSFFFFFFLSFGKSLRNGSVAEQRAGAGRSGSSTGMPQPASALLGHKGMMLLELIGMLGLNSLMLVNHLMVFWWKVLGLQWWGGGGCAP